MKKIVLIVDDDPDVRLFNQTVVEESGYESIEASNGEKGLEMALKYSPNLVILDVLMPKQSGVRLYRELKTTKELKNIPVILLSGVAKKTFLISQKALTGFGGSNVPEPTVYLEKPVEPEELARELRNILE